MCVVTYLIDILYLNIYVLLILIKANSKILKLKKRGEKERRLLNTLTGGPAMSSNF